MVASAKFKGWLCNIWRCWKRNSDIKWLYLRLLCLSCSLHLLSLPVSYNGLRRGHKTLIYILTCTVVLTNRSMSRKIKLFWLYHEHTLSSMYFWAIHLTFTNVKIINQEVILQTWPLNIFPWNQHETLSAMVMSRVRRQRPVRRTAARHRHSNSHVFHLQLKPVTSQLASSAIKGAAANGESGLKWWSHIF